MTDGKNILSVSKECSFFHDEMTEGDLIPIPLEIKEFFSSHPKELNKEQLCEYILFYDFLGHARNLAMSVHTYLQRGYNYSLGDTLDTWISRIKTGEHLSYRGYEEIVRLQIAHGDLRIGEVIKSGNLELLKALNPKVRLSHLKKASRYNQLPMIEYMLEKRPIFEKKVIFIYIMDAAIEKGNLPIIKYLLSRGHQQGFMIEDAMKTGQIEVLKYLLDQGFETTINNPFFVPRTWEMYDLLLKHRLIQPQLNHYARVAQRGDLEYLKYLHSKDPTHIDILFSAIGSGNVKMVEYLHSLGCPQGGAECWLAVIHNRSGTLRFLLREGYARGRTEELLEFTMECQGKRKCREIIEEALEEEKALRAEEAKQ